MNLMTAVLVLLGLIGLDVAVGIAKAVAAKTFDPRKLPAFLETTVPLGQMIATALLGVVQAVQQSGDTTSKGLAAAFLVALTALGSKVLADIASKLSATA